MKVVGEGIDFTFGTTAMPGSEGTDGISLYTHISIVFPSKEQSYLIILSIWGAVQQFKNGRKRKEKMALHLKRRKIFSVKSNCGTASWSLNGR